MRTPGFSGAELANVINEASILQVRTKLNEVDLNTIDEAIDRVIGGPSKPNNVISKEEKEMIAYHESGHALIGLIKPKSEKVQRISIVPRGGAGGYVLMTPKKEKFVQTKSELEAKIVSYMGGRAAEEIYFGKEEISTGAYSDIQEATKIARRMVTEFGMSSLGPVQYEQQQGSVFLGRDYNNASKQFSSDVGRQIDEQIRKFIDLAYADATKIIKENDEYMKLFAKALILKETLNTEEIEYIFENKKLQDSILKLEKTTKKATEPKKTPKPKMSFESE